MLDLKIISYKLTINVKSYVQEYLQYPVGYTYKNKITAPFCAQLFKIKSSNETNCCLNFSRM